MQAVAFRVSCPNCGQPAARHFLEAQQQVRTQCPSCDYLITISSETGSVIEAYAPGLPVLAR